jgi:hypothetical protein
MDNISIMPVFPDWRSAAAMSSLLFKRYGEQAKGSKYLILCSWPGLESLFPSASEYWSVTPETMKSLFWKSIRFSNETGEVVSVIRKLTRYFDEVIGGEELDQFYHDGLTTRFFERFDEVKVFKPMVPSPTILGNKFNNDLGNRRTVMIYPSCSISSWNKGRLTNEWVGNQFWIALAKRLLSEGYTPVIWKDSVCHDISGDFGEDCIYLNTDDLRIVFSAMRTVGCVLDVFTGISRLAMLARTPFLSCDERARYSQQREYEFDDLCGAKIPREYIFSFAAIIRGGDRAVWESSIIDGLMSRLNAMHPDLNRDYWPATSEVEESVPYSRVRKIQSRRLGTRFIKVPKL